MKIAVMWYDPLLSLLIGLTLGGYFFGSVPCFIANGSKMICFSAGILTAASVFSNFEFWVLGNQLEMLEMKVWILASIGVVWAVIIAIRICQYESKSFG